jgi:hypothetical protein
MAGTGVSVGGRSAQDVDEPGVVPATRPVSGRHADGAAIETSALTKDYGNGHGVFALDLEMRRGEVLGFLAPGTLTVTG